jgi:hypothetical protein
MIITGFLGYKNNSPTMYNTYNKRFNNINSLVLNRRFSLRNNSLFTNQIRYNLNDSSLNIRYYSTNTNDNKYDELFNELKINPIYHFDNLDNLNTRVSILNTVKGLSGIYIVINKVTKNYYIGSAITNRFYKRFCSHLIYFTGSKILRDSVNKHGLSNFIFGVLEIFPELITQETNKELLKLEDKYLKTYLPKYNILLEAGNSFGYKHTEETILRIKNNYTEERKEILRQYQTNRKGL